MRTEDIPKTLVFSTKRFKPTENIVVFAGEFINVSQYTARCEEGKSGYAIHFSADHQLDCYKARHDGRCKTSLANSPYNCWNTRTSSKARANAVLKVGMVGGIHRAMLRDKTWYRNFVELWFRIWVASKIV
jgi:hypothetical protein